MYSLDQLKQNIEAYPNSERVLPRSKRATVHLAEDVKYIDVCILSNVLVGLVKPHKQTSKFDKPFRINKFIAHVKELSDNPNARVFLGGDLFYFPGGSAEYRELYSPSYHDQIELMAELLMPIKDKIIGAYDGTDEAKIFEKDGINMTKELMEKMGIADRYFGQMAEVDFVFRNDYTNHTPKVVNMLFDHGFLAANVLGTVARKTEGLQDKINGKDFYFTSHYNKMYVEKTAMLQADNSSHMIKRPCYFVAVGGYRDYPNRLTSNRNVSPANTDNAMIRVFVAPNPDRNNIRGNNYLGEPQYKVCQEFINFGRTSQKDFDFDLIKENASYNEQNELNKLELIERIKQKVEENNRQNSLSLLQKYYSKEYELIETPKLQKGLDKKITIKEKIEDKGEEK